MNQAAADHLSVTEPLIDHTLQLDLQEDQLQHFIAQLLSGASKELQLYVVIGVSGVYADRSTWVVRAFLSKAQADAFAIRCERDTSKLAENRAAAGIPSWKLFDDLPKGFIDPKAKHIDYPPSYSVTKVPLSELRAL